MTNFYTEWIYPLFVWASLPLQNQPNGDGIYWKFFDDNLRKNVIRSAETKLKLQSILTEYLPEIPLNQRSEYNNPAAILNTVAIDKVPLVRLIGRFLSLCELERKVMKGVVATARALLSRFT